MVVVDTLVHGFYTPGVACISPTFPDNLWLQKGGVQKNAQRAYLEAQHAACHGRGGHAGHHPFFSTAC